MSTYQGHHSDGSSIQKHSAGGAYPFILQLRDNPAGGTWWELIGPGIETALRFSSSAEWDAAVRRLLAVREDADAWAFELEQLQHVAGQRVRPMQDAARTLGWNRWDDMTKCTRVCSLMALGRVRNMLRLPPGTQKPVFASLAAAAV